MHHHGTENAVKGLHDHWVEMPEWLPGRELWAFYLTFDGAGELHARVEHDQAALAGVPGLEMIPRPRLHLSVQGILFRDQVQDTEIEQLTRAVGDAVAGRTLPQLFTGPAMNDYDAVGLPVYPAEDLVALRDLIRLTAADQLGPERIYQLPESETGYVPHISLAYAYQEVGGADLAAGLARTDQGRCAVDVHHLSLVALRRADRAWSWDQEIRLPFAQRVSVSR